MLLIFHSSNRNPSGLMVKASDQYSEGLGFRFQLDPRFFFSADFLSQQNISIHKCLLSLPVNNIKPLMF